MLSRELSLRTLLIMAASAIALTACADTSVESPGEENQVPPPSNGGGGDDDDDDDDDGGDPGSSDFALIPAGGCAEGTTEETFTVSGSTVDACAISGTITADVELTSDGVYFLDGPVFVGDDLGADGGNDGPTLTIPAGARIAGSAGADYLVVARGSTLNAEGAADNPILMTSAQDIIATESGEPRDGTETVRGEWGGLVINGRAPINACNDGDAAGGTVDCEKSGEGSSGEFGGADPADSSGSLRYMQVRFAGFRVNATDELNGIAFQGTGSGTVAEYLQVHNNVDDGIEFFGGTTNGKYFVLTGNGDDSLDYTDGWTGNVQFVTVKQADDDGDQGFEFDNNGDNNAALPRSNPTIANYTLLGSRDNSASDVGMLLREGTAGTFVNGIVVDFNETCLDVNNAETHAQADSGDLVIQSNYFDCVTNFASDDDGFDEEAFFLGQANNTTGDNTMSNVFPGPEELAVEAVDPTQFGSFFDAVDYIGAFSPEETNENNWAAGWTFGLLEDPECPAGTEATGEVLDGEEVCAIDGIIQDDVTLVAGLKYELVGPVFVGRDLGPDPENPVQGGVSATLTINPGVTVFGSAGADYLVVARGSRIESNGTANAPVIMTGRDELEGNADVATSRGLWGGLVINGRAPINACNDGGATGGTVDCEKSGEGSSGEFGGATADDDSGSLRYTRVQYAGFRVNATDELNGIAFQGTGSGTEVDYVQVHNNVDDGIEFFGGTTNAKHLVLTGIGDDSLDYTDGWVGNVQYVIVQHATDDGDQGFEFDSNGDNNAATPRSNPNISNYTLIGQRANSASDVGMLLREGTAGTFVNGIVVDFNETCLDVNNAETYAQADSGDLVIQSNFFDCNTNFAAPADGFDEEDFFLNGADNANNTVGTTSLAGFSFISDMSANNATGVVPAADGPEADVTVFDPTTLDAYFDAVDYIGAVRDADDDWYAGWTLSQQ